MRDFSTAFLAHVLALISFVLDHRNASSARGHDLEKDQHMQKTLSASGNFVHTGPRIGLTTLDVWWLLERIV